MGLEFLRNYGARRVSSYPALPVMLQEGVTLSEADNETVALNYERHKSEWEPCPTGSADSAQNDRSDVEIEWPFCPRFFIDGKDVGRTVAWLRNRDGWPVPVRLSEIGAMAIRHDKGVLRRDAHRVERVVSMMADYFPWDEIEAFAGELQAAGFRLLICRRPDPGVNPFDFERMRQNASDRSRDEMIRLERQILSQTCPVPTVVDGGLQRRAGAFDPEAHAVTGLIKTHSRDYLHTQGWQTLYDLKPGERTPVFGIEGQNASVVSWYLRIDGANGDMPNWGIVRVETPRRFFESRVGQDWNYVNRLSRLLWRYRTRDGDYGRAAVTIQPIQRVEEKLSALSTGMDTLTSRFYRLTSL